MRGLTKLKLKPKPWRPSSPLSHFATLSDSSSLIQRFTQHCYQTDLPKAISAMQAMQSLNLRADPTTYSALLKSCLPHHVTLVHSHLFSNGSHPPTFLTNTLINLYVKFGKLEEAEKLFDEMPERNVVSWTTMISAYCRRRMNDKALAGFVSMVREGVGPNSFTYSSVLRACEGVWELKELHCGILKAGLESDVFVRSAIIDVYAKLGELRSARGVFDEMVTGDAVVWSSIVGAFAQNSEACEALELFKRMKRAGFGPEEATLTSILRSCTLLALLELGRQVHVHAIKYGPDLILNNALLDMYCKCGSLEDANDVFTRMGEKDVISWSTMIAGLAQNGFSHEALKLFEEMKVLGTKPNYITVLGVLFACSHAGLLEQGWYYFQNMRKLFGIEPGREHYGCVIDLLGRAGKLDEAARLIQEMDCEPDAVTWRTLLGACRVHRNVDLATHAAKQILKMDPDDAGTYILLSNLYAISQRWDDVAKVRKSMRAKGITKEPGCSWVEVNKQIHAFIMGDESHPQIDEINKQLNKLIDILMRMGYVPDTNFVLQDLEGEQREASLQSHSERLAIVFGIMNLPKGIPVRVRKNLRICGDCHEFAKLVAKLENRTIVIRDPIRYHHFQDGKCSCGDYW